MKLIKKPKPSVWVKIFNIIFTIISAFGTVMLIIGSIQAF